MKSQLCQLFAFKLPRSPSYTAARAAEFHQLHPAGAREEMRENARAPEIHAMGLSNRWPVLFGSPGRGGEGGMGCLRKRSLDEFGKRKKGGGRGSLDRGEEQDIVPSVVYHEREVGNRCWPSVKVREPQEGENH